MATLLGLTTRVGSVESASPTTPPAIQVVITNFATATNVVQVTVTNYVSLTNQEASVIRRPAGRTNSALPALNWVPPEDQFDWVQLKSGEWLKGKIKAMQKRELEYDSEEMELQTFDWKDIRQLRSPHINDLLYGESQAVSGPIAITPEQVRVGGSEPRSFARSELQSITPGGAKERNRWSGKLSLGLSPSSGKTKTVDYNASASLQHRTPDARLRLDYLGNLSSVNNVDSANNNRASVEFDYWLSRWLYLVMPYTE